ncbi:hypothetical protein Fcan01_12487, partial [Folsomia candida]
DEVVRESAPFCIYEIIQNLGNEFICEKPKKKTKFDSHSSAVHLKSQSHSQVTPLLSSSCLAFLLHHHLSSFEIAFICEITMISAARSLSTNIIVQENEIEPTACEDKKSVPDLLGPVTVLLALVVVVVPLS